MWHLRRLRRLLTALLSIPALSLVAGAKADVPVGFWPEGRPAVVEGYDHWRVWVARVEAQAVPTSVFSLLDRQNVLRMWVEELARRGAPVTDVAPRSRMERLARMITTGETLEACREVDALFRGLEDLVALDDRPRTVGTITGAVMDTAGAPVAGTAVTVPGTPLGAFSDTGGRFSIRNVPGPLSRHILRAHRRGFLDGWAGVVSTEAEQEGQAVILLEVTRPEMAFREGVLDVRFARTVEFKEILAPPVPAEEAVIDPEAYPAPVRPYLRASGTVDADHPRVREAAQGILASVDEAARGNSTAVATAVHGWVCRNIPLDTLERTPFDPTGGHWQLTHGAWGRGLDEWLRTPSRILLDRRAVGLEHARLAAALLRALQVPARPAWTGIHAVCQWWVQPPEGDGFWANMNTFAGRKAFTDTGQVGDLQAVGNEQIALYSVDVRAGVHVTWNALRPCLWIKGFGEWAAAEAGERGAERAAAMLESFTQTGRIPRAARLDGMAPPDRKPAAGHEVASQGIRIHLASLRGQDELTVRFPMYLINDHRATVAAGHWTNQPAWIKDTRREQEVNEHTGESMEWYCIDLALGGIPPAPEADPEGGQ